MVEWVSSQYQLTSDENGCLAVLHNRNKMVTTFGNSEWVTQSEGSVQSKSVTSCAGMTAHLVLLAQTRVGFLSGGRSKRMKDLSQNEFLAQLDHRSLNDESAKTTHHHGSPGHARAVGRCDRHWLPKAWCRRVWYE